MEMAVCRFEKEVTCDGREGSPTVWTDEKVRARSVNEDGAGVKPYTVETELEMANRAPAAVLNFIAL